MRNLIFVFTLFSVCVLEQTENFFINGSEVYWQKIFESKKDFNEIKEIIKEKNNVKITEVTENKINGELNNFTMNYKKAGYSYMSTPIILNESNKYSANFTIEFKDNKYRVTVRNVSSKGIDMYSFSGGLGISSNVSTTLEELALKKGQFKNQFIKTTSKIIDVTFIDKFDVENIQLKENDNW